MTVALRLAETNGLSVAVIEAGGFCEIDSGNFSQITAYESLFLNAPPSIDWGIYALSKVFSVELPSIKMV